MKLRSENGGPITRRIASVTLILFALYWLALFVGTHLPGRVVAASGQPDKLLHLLGYGGLAFLAGLACGLRWPWTARQFLLLFGGLILYAALDELLQVPIPGRHGDVADWLADAGGSLLGLLAVTVVLLTWRRLTERNRRGG